MTTKKHMKPLVKISPEEALYQLDGAYSPDSLRWYRSDLGTFFRWCGENDVDLPVAAEDLARFIDEQGHLVAAGSAVRRLVAIGHYHRLEGYEDPSKAPQVRLAVRRIRRLFPRRPRQALGLTAELRDTLIEHCPDTLHGKRDRAMFAVGYDTLCRRSELVALRAEDITRKDGGGASILVRRSKSDPFGRGRLASISRRGWAELDAWMTTSGIEEGPLFRRIYQGYIQPDSIGPEQVSRLLKRRAQEAGLDSET
jgi:integrase/recombinase XerD